MAKPRQLVRLGWKPREAQTHPRRVAARCLREQVIQAWEIIEGIVLYMSGPGGNYVSPINFPAGDTVSLFLESDNGLAPIAGSLCTAEPCVFGSASDGSIGDNNELSGPVGSIIVASSRE